MSFSMLFCIVFTMGAVFFDCKWEKVPNLWIIAGLQISMAEHLSGEVIQGLGSAVIRFWGGIFLVLFLFFWQILLPCNNKIIIHIKNQFV